MDDTCHESRVLMSVRIALPPRLKPCDAGWVAVRLLEGLNEERFFRVIERGIIFLD